MRVLVLGATGQTGRVLVQQALERHHVVTGFGRRAAADTVPAGARALAGNVADYAAVSAAVAGQDAVVSALGVGTPLKHDRDVIEGVGNVIRAMEAHGVRRLVYLSFIGVRESRAAVGFLLRFVAPLPLRHEIADHEAKEALVRASRLDWTIVRPPKLTNGRVTGTCRSGEAIATWKPIPLVSRGDVARFILEELQHPAYVHRFPRLLH